LKCAHCKQNPRNACDKTGFDCTGGKLELPEYALPENRPFHALSSVFQCQFGNTLTRLEELIKFCEAMSYRKLGLAFCVGLAREAGDLATVMESRGFRVESVCCKVVGLKKDDFGLEKVDREKCEILCNPVAQAKILNRAKTELNIELGLCVGHDILFHKYARAPVTVFAVKDRVLAHNPLGVFQASYLRRRFGLEE